MVVMLSHFEHTLARYIAAAEHVFQERDDVFGALRSTERHNQDCVVPHKQIGYATPLMGAHPVASAESAAKNLMPLNFSLDTTPV
jgi:hypothetical protein